MTLTIFASAELELELCAKHRIAERHHTDEASGSVAATCRYYGISRQTY